MKDLNLRDIPDEVHSALSARAEQHGRSAEAEAREILKDAVLANEAFDEAVVPDMSLPLGTRLADIGRRVGMTDEEYAIFTQRDYSPDRPIDLE